MNKYTKNFLQVLRSVLSVKKVHFISILKNSSFHELLNLFRLAAIKFRCGGHTGHGIKAEHGCNPSTDGRVGEFRLGG